jgi:hypothetical protein
MLNEPGVSLGEQWWSISRVRSSLRLQILGPEKYRIDLFQDAWCKAQNATFNTSHSSSTVKDRPDTVRELDVVLGPRLGQDAGIVYAYSSAVSSSLGL